VRLVAIVALAAMMAATVSCSTTSGSSAARTPLVELWRLDCGMFDVKNIGGQRRILSNGCYLVRHGSDYLLWDAGLEDTLLGKPEVTDSQTLSLDRALLPQLAEIGVKADDVRMVGVSHGHGDHYGQAARFPNATLLIGRRDWASIQAAPDGAALVKPWIEGKAPVLQLDGDHDVFGDGKVVVLATPGHTEAHQSLLVRLDSGAVLLSGDAVHFRNQLETRRPSGNHVDKVRGVQSIDRMLSIGKSEPARIIVQHDPEDVGLLPKFPSSLR
jgi:glyoxylase-like metal-dependent hydrolase (beta-lactamase superfamily II)